MGRFHPILGILVVLLLVATLAESKDLYKVLGVEKNASQRDIQKAFHKLSLKYHPDKNKDKSAQAKFAEINNAYETLSDEEKRKNYDMFGDEQGSPRFEGGGPGGPGDGSTHFNFDGQKSRHFTFQQGTYQSGGSGSGGNSFMFDFGSPNFMGDIFSDLFGFAKGQGNRNPFGSFTSAYGGAESGFRDDQASRHHQNIQALDSKSFKETVLDQGSTWLLMFYTPSSKGYQEGQVILEQVANTLQGIVKVGAINCQTQSTLCKEHGVWPQKTSKIFVYSLRSHGKGTLIEYNGDWNAKDLKSYCLDLLPRFSKRLDINDINDLSRTSQKLPQVLLLTTKKYTPSIWRALSGLYHTRALFYDTEVHDASDPVAKKFGVESLPAMVGFLSNGEKLILNTGDGFEQLGAQRIKELGKLIENLEKKNLKVSAGKASSQSSSDKMEQIGLLTKESAERLCGTNTPLCIIGAFRSFHGREKVKAVLTAVSQKTFTRGGQRFGTVKDPVSYSLLDASKQKAFLNAFHKSGFKAMDTVLVAYKPRKGRFAFHEGPLTSDNVERFVSAALNGDVQFRKVLQKPELY